MTPIKVGILGAPGQQKTAFAVTLARRMATATHGDAAKVLGLHMTGDLMDLAADKINVVAGLNCSPESVIEGVKHAVENGYAAVVIDNLSFEWNGAPGSVMDMVDREISNKNDTNQAWRIVRPKHAAMLAYLRAAPIHIVAVYWSKTEIVVSQDDTGRAQPVRILKGLVGPEDTELHWPNFIEMRIDGSSIIFWRTPMLDLLERVFGAPWEEIFTRYEQVACATPPVVTKLPPATDKKSSTATTKPGTQQSPKDPPATTSAQAGAEKAQAPAASQDQASNDQAKSNSGLAAKTGEAAEVEKKPVATETTVPPSAKDGLIKSILAVIGHGNDEKLNSFLRTHSRKMPKAWLKSGEQWRDLPEERLRWLSLNGAELNRMIGLAVAA